MGTLKIFLGVLFAALCFNECLSQTFTSYAKTCNDCNSTNANCEQKSNYVVCSCKPGFIGNGLNCTRIVFCTSGNCCPPGYSWDITKKVCNDINECSPTNNPLNKCDGTCANKNGMFLCGNTVGLSCNENGACSLDKDCIKINGVSECSDPCSTTKQLDGASRLYTIDSVGRFPTDRYEFGWYRFTDGFRMKEGCVGSLKCGSLEPFSLAGSHPTEEEGIKLIPLMINGLAGCTNGAKIPVKACPGGNYVYKFTGTLKFDVYCSEPVKTTTSKPPITTTVKPPTSTTTTLKPPISTTTLKPPTSTTTTLKPPISTTTPKPTTFNTTKPNPPTTPKSPSTPKPSTFNTTTPKSTSFNTTTSKPPTFNTTTPNPPTSNTTTPKPPTANITTPKVLTTPKPTTFNTTTPKPTTLNTTTSKPPTTNTTMPKPTTANTTIPSISTPCTNLSLTTTVIPPIHPYPNDNITVTHVQSRSVITVRILNQTINNKEVNTLEINETTTVTIELKTITPNFIYFKTTISKSPTLIRTLLNGMISESSSDKQDTQVSTNEASIPNTGEFQTGDFCSKPGQTKTTVVTSSSDGNSCSGVVSALTTTTVATTEEVIVAGPFGIAASCP